MWLLDVATGQSRLCWKKPNATGLAFSPDGKYVVSGTESNVVLFDLKDYQQIKQFTGHKDFVQALVFTDDSQQIISVSYDQTVRFWDIASGKEVRQFTVAEGVPNAVALSARSRFLLVGTNLGKVYRWDLATGQALSVLEVHKDAVKALVTSRTDDRFLTGSMDGGAKLWDMEGNVLQSFDGHKGPVFTVALSPDSTIAATGSGDKTMRLWNTATGKELLPPKGHTDIVSSLSVSCTAEYLASVGWDRTVRLWHLSCGSEARSWPTETEAAAVAIDHAGKHVAVGDSTTIVVWNTSNGEVLYKLTGHTSQVRWLGFGKEGELLYSAGWEGELRIWDMNTGTLLTKLTTGASLECVAVLGHGTTLACGDWSGNISLWDVASGKQVGTWKAHTLVVNGLVASANDEYLISSSEDGTIKLWKTNGSLLNSAQPGTVLRLAMLAGAEPAVAVLLQGKKLELWSVPGWQKLQSFSGLTQPSSVGALHHGADFWIGNGNGTIYWYKK